MASDSTCASATERTVKVRIADTCTTVYELPKEVVDDGFDSILKACSEENKVKHSVDDMPMTIKRDDTGEVLEP